MFPVQARVRGGSPINLYVHSKLNRLVRSEGVYAGVLVLFKAALVPIGSELARARRPRAVARPDMA